MTKNCEKCPCYPDGVHQFLFPINYSNYSFVNVSNIHNEHHHTYRHRSSSQGVFHSEYEESGFEKHTSTRFRAAQKIELSDIELCCICGLVMTTPEELLVKAAEAIYTGKEDPSLLLPHNKPTLPALFTEVGYLNDSETTPNNDCSKHHVFRPYGTVTIVILREMDFVTTSNGQRAITSRRVDRMEKTFSTQRCSSCKTVTSWLRTEPKYLEGLKRVSPDMAPFVDMIYKLRDLEKDKSLSSSNPRQLKL